MAQGHEHHHHHDDAGGEHYSDPASQSLANALKVSFRLLTLIMIGVVVAFLLTGIKTIESNQVGIKTRLGQVVGLAPQGLAYTWPYPVGDIEIANVQEQQVNIDDFWLYELPGEQAKPLLDRKPTVGLTPGRDSALLTGDHNLLHMRLACKYKIADPLAYRQNVGPLDMPQDDLNAPIRSAVAKAAIRAAAHYTADGLQRTNRDDFAGEVRTVAQAELDRLGAGMQLTQVLLVQTTWPLRTLLLVTEAQNAVSEAEQRRNQARANAESTLNGAAGPAYKLLVGDPTRIHTVTATAPASRAAKDRQAVLEEGGLIGLYRQERDAAARTGDFSRAEQVLAQIDELLTSSAVGGLASQIISMARADSTATVERAKSRAERFSELVAEYEKAPQLMLERLWAQTRDDILSGKSVEKFYLSMGSNKTVVQINRSPEIIRQLSQEEAAQAAQRRGQTMAEAAR